MLSLAEFAALGAALCWSVSGIMSAGPSRHIGPLAFVRIRMTMVVAVLAVWLLLRGEFGSQILALPAWQLVQLGLSGVIGIWLGDVMLFVCMNRLGPRRTAILFASNAPMQVLLGMIFLGESMSAVAFLGCALVIMGTYFAIIFGKRRDQIHQWEEIKGLLIVGVAFGLLAAFGQAVGALIAKPVLEAGVSATAATTIRVAAAVAVLWLMLLLPIPHQRIHNSLSPRILGLCFISGTLGMTIGMSLLLYGLKHGDLGTIAILSSVSTTLMLPLLWWVTKERPAIGAWLGALLVMAGIAAIKLG